MKMTIGDYLISQLANYGVKQMFGVPGDYILSFLDLVEDNKNVEWIGCCNELNASYAADGYGRINGMGALCVTYGVGALSGINGVAGSYAERVPVVVIAGRPSEQSIEDRAYVHHSLGNGEFDIFCEIYSKVTCAQEIIVERYAQQQIDSILYKCFVEKLPVYIELCSDLAKMEFEVVEKPFKMPEMPKSKPEVLAQFIADVKTVLASSKNQMIVADYKVLRYKLTDKVTNLVNVAKVPATTLNMGKGAFDETSPYYAGVYAGVLEDQSMAAIVKDTDCALLIGVKFTDSTTGLKNPNPNMKFIKVNPFSCQIGDNHYNNIFMGDVLDELAKLSYKSSVAIPKKECTVAPASDKPLSQDRVYALFENYIKGNVILGGEQGTSFFGLSPMRLPKNTSFIGQPLWGSIGYTLPATMGAAIADKSRRAFLFIGDGSFQLTAQDVSTMLRNKLNCVVFLDNNNGYTVEKVIHGMHRQYNNVNMWKYSELPKVFNMDDSISIGLKVSSELELVHAFEICDKNPDKLIFVEMLLPEFDMPELLASVAPMFKEEDHY